MPRLHVQIARTDAEHRRGLAGRPTLPPDAGMLFVFPAVAQASFTNAGTLVPLSLAFLDSDLRVLELGELPSIHETLRPVTCTPRQGARYVVEAPRGWFFRAGVKAGDRLTLHLQPDGRSGIMEPMDGAASWNNPPVPAAAPFSCPAPLGNERESTAGTGVSAPVWNLEQPTAYGAPASGYGAPASAEIRIGENGYIHGVDGMLDQIAAALSRHAGPMLVRDVLPVVRADHELQARVGSVVGDRIAQELKPYLIAGAVGLGALAILGAWALMRSPAPPPSPASSVRARARRRAVNRAALR